MRAVLLPLKQPQGGSNPMCSPHQAVGLYTAAENIVKTPKTCFSYKYNNGFEMVLNGCKILGYLMLFSRKWGWILDITTLFQANRHILGFRLARRGSTE